MSYSGRFKPKNYKKYTGDPTKIVYRSLWERRFMQYCDDNNNIIEWGSEEIIIPYISPVDKKVHRYFPDFYIKVRESNGSIQKYIIEVKPQPILEIDNIAAFDQQEGLSLSDDEINYLEELAAKLGFNRYLLINSSAISGVFVK